MIATEDEILFGWDPTPGIVSVYADQEGNALVFRRIGGELHREEASFRPWVLGAHMDDLGHLGSALAHVRSPGAMSSPFQYQELDGDEGSYRYLLMARSGRALARAILTGASRRMGRQVRGLSELESYYRAGPVEQYLMQTGRVYFRGLRYDDLHRMQIDLETTSLDPATGRIFLCAVRDSRGLAITLEARAPSDERRLIEELCQLVRERDPDVIENHNLFGFDLPFLVRRAEAQKVRLTLGRPGGPALPERYQDGPGGRRARYTLAGRELVDTLDAVRRHDFIARDLPNHRLKDVARHFGVASEERVYLPGSQIYGTYLRDPSLVRRYALDDVAEVDALSTRLQQAPFALAGMAPRRYERLCSAGPATGVLEPMLVRAYVHARAALPAPGGGGADLGPHAGGALHLFATGVAERVVKADIASLYPSLMRAYKIGPACDRLGALLHIVERLLDLRLKHKAAARKAREGSLDPGHHEALQAAMKLVINAAYGYMGAGSIALFADRHAADEVTRRGRAILDDLIASLRARGVALIEADTDGVYFAVPEGSTDAEERALVAAVAEELPAGIRLEYEGRFQAMFSYEVKNYALLTYSGEVILRGVALRSSRAEPFGERFLREALRLTMRGDVLGVRQLFLRTVDALRRRSLPLADVAARTRLSKSPEGYLATRAAHREAPYEALLAAGRTRWAPGERVRYYRARSGAHVWLPDEGEDASLSHAETSEADEEIEAMTLTPSAQRARASSAATGVEVKRDYDIDHYLHVLVTSYASRLRKAFEPEDFERLFRLDEQYGLFDRPINAIEPRWIRCAPVAGREIRAVRPR